MRVEPATRAGREVRHGEFLAAGNPERTWGWGTPAGQLRAARRAALIAAGAGLGPGVHALELGCGTGLFTEFFAATGARITAIDLSDDLLAFARARSLDPSRVQFQLGRFEDLRGAEPFDAVVGSSVLHHLDLHDAIENAIRLLKPGGRFSFAEPNMLNPQVFLERQFSFLPIFSYTSPDETAFVRWRLARTLERHGLSDIRITPFDWLHPHTPPALIPAVSAIGALIEAIPIAREFSGSLSIRACKPANA
jgi:SAM-dependent methyltransferase